MGQGMAVAPGGVTNRVRQIARTVVARIRPRGQSVFAIIMTDQNSARTVTPYVRGRLRRNP